MLTNRVATRKAEDFVFFVEGRHYVAIYDQENNQYVGPLRDTSNGLQRFWCRNKQQLPKLGGFSYLGKSDAVRAVRRLHNEGYLGFGSWNLR